MTPIENAVTIKLHEPWWGAWKKYGWERGTPGFGVREGIVREALAEGKKILISTKGISYIVEAQKVTDFLNEQEQLPKYKTAKGTSIIVLPKTLFDEIG